MKCKGLVEVAVSISQPLCHISWNFNSLLICKDCPVLCQTWFNVLINCYWYSISIIYSYFFPIYLVFATQLKKRFLKKFSPPFLAQSCVCHHQHNPFLLILFLLKLFKKFHLPFLYSLLLQPAAAAAALFQLGEHTGQIWLKTLMDRPVQPTNQNHPQQQQLEYLSHYHYYHYPVAPSLFRPL